VNRSVRTRRRDCPACAHRNGGVPPGPYSRDPWDVVECLKCGFVYLRTVPLAEELSETLAWEVSAEREAERRRKEQPVLDWIDRKTRWRLRILPRIEPAGLLMARVRTGPVLDVGCGSGIRFAELPISLVPYGIEISKALAAGARARFLPRGGDVIHGAAKDALRTFADGFFAGALLRSYLEHDADAPDVLRILKRKMREGGIAVVKVPNYGSWNRRLYGRKWCGFRWPDHVNYFTQKSLREMAESAGFSVRFPRILSLPTDDNMVAILAA